MFKKAIKRGSYLRIIFSAPSGAGKTYTSLRIAKGIASKMNTKIAVIDSERGTAKKYADRFDFDVAELEDASIDSYIKNINEAKNNEYGVLILDSISHAWQTLLEEVEKIAQQKFRGNTFRAWAVGTPKQREFIRAILDYPGHIIATSRAKMEYVIDEDSKGRKEVKKLGLAAEQGKGIEYEFDMLIEMDINHIAHVTKDRTGKYQDEYIECPDEKLGEDLYIWINDGASLSDLKKIAIDSIKKATTKNELMDIWNSNRDLHTDEEFVSTMTDRKTELGIS